MEYLVAILGILLLYGQIAIVGTLHDVCKEIRSLDGWRHRG